MRAVPWLCAILILAGCASEAPPPGDAGTTPPAAAQLYVSRPLQTIPEPDAFVQGVVTAFVEALVLRGYDLAGVLYDPEDEATMRTHLQAANQRVPGTFAFHFEFVEAPIVVGFGTAYTSIRCALHGPNGEVRHEAQPDPPARVSLKDLLLPPKQPDVAGRLWGAELWAGDFAAFFPPRR